MKNLIKFVLVLATAAAFSACSKIDSVLDKAETIPGKLDTMTEKMGTLEDKTQQGKEEDVLLDEKNYEVLSPVPYRVFVAAKLFTERLTAQKLVDWVDIKLSEINGAKAIDMFADVNSAEAIKFEHTKMGQFVMLTAVSGLMPDSTANEIVAKIQRAEGKTKTMLAILAMRSYFLESVLLKEKYAPTELASIGDVEDAIGYNKSLETILRLPFAPAVKVQTVGFMNNDQNDTFSFGLNMDAAKNAWKSLSDGLTRYVKVSQYSTDAAETNSQLARQTAALNAINQGMAEWSTASQVVP